MKGNSTAELSNDERWEELDGMGAAAGICLEYRGLIGPGWVFDEIDVSGGTATIKLGDGRSVRVFRKIGGARNKFEIKESGGSEWRETDETRKMSAAFF